MSERKRRCLAACLAIAAAALLGASLKLPLWRLRMEAPQYRDEEALKVAVYPSSWRGDLGEIRVLNQYIGVHLPERLPQFQWLPTALISAAAAGLAALLLPSRARVAGLVASPVLLSLALGVAAAQAQAQMYDIGHHRDSKTTLVGVKDFTPPLLGKTRIAQFDVASALGSGAFLAGTAVVCQLAAAWLSRRGVGRASPADEAWGHRTGPAEAGGSAPITASCPALPQRS